jgi:2'-hydroxyisoflavone reductase
MVEAGQTGIFNANGPDYPLTMEGTLETCKEVSVSDATFTWVSDEFLLAHKVEPWIGLPLWIPESDPSTAGFFAFNCSKAITAGLTFRPLTDTVAATLAWEAARPEDHAWRAGIPREREAELLEEWKRTASETAL